MTTANVQNQPTSGHIIGVGLVSALKYLVRTPENPVLIGQMNATVIATACHFEKAAGK